MEKIKRTREYRNRRPHPFLKGLFITLFCVAMLALGFIAAGVVFNVLNLI